MDQRNQVLTLYTAQTEPVLRALERDGVCYNRECYIRRKYGEVAEIFLTVYREFYRNASNILPPPPQAESAYWAFADPRDVFVGDNQRLLRLEVPADQVILFDVCDWNKILKFGFLGENEAEERAFARELRERGVTELEVMLSRFYPELRQQILASWARLLRHHDALLRGDQSGVRAVQAGLWQLKKEWLGAPDGLPQKDGGNGK